MTTALSNSKVKTFLRCPKKFEYRYVENLQPRRKELPLERGTWIHECLEAYYKGKDWKKTHAKLTKQFRQLFEEEREMLGNDLPQECERIVKSYLNHWDDSDWKIIAVELEYNIKIRGRQYKGKIDLVIKDNLGVWVIDHKTNKTMPKEATPIMDPQMTLYAAVLEKKGLKCAGTIHNHIRTKAPKDPKVLKSGELSKAKCDTDYRTYLRAIKKLGLDVEEYRDQLNALKAQKDKFFVRYRVPMKRAAVKSMFSDYEVIGEIIDRMKVFPRNISIQCKRDCPFLKICLIELNGGNADTVKRLNFRVDERAYG